MKYTVKAVSTESGEELYSEELALYERDYVEHVIHLFKDGKEVVEVTVTVDLT